MKKETLLKLLDSTSYEDKLLVINYLSENMSSNQMIEFFNNNGPIAVNVDGSWLSSGAFDAHGGLLYSYYYNKSKSIGFYLGKYLYLVSYPHPSMDGYNPTEL